ncbi:MAG: hypothetical protein IT307_11950 [Chloroflexi bacterium]|nr:hypothetical protein [Chloroflexota bacterium]
MVQTTNGYQYARFGDLPWRKRSEDNWPPMIKRVFVDEQRNLSANFVWYGRDVTEPRHTHPGTHATFLLVGTAAMDGRTVGPSDLVYGPGGVPHGPLRYENGCVLFGMTHGGFMHTAVDDSVTTSPSDGMPPRLVAERDIPWEGAQSTSGALASQVKLMLHDRAREYIARVIRWPAGSTSPRHVHPGSHAAVVMAGTAVIGDETFAPWDMIYGPGDDPHGPIHVPDETILLVCGVGDLVPRQVE